MSPGDTNRTNCPNEPTKWLTLEYWIQQILVLLTCQIWGVLLHEKANGYTGIHIHTERVIRSAEDCGEWWTVVMHIYPKEFKYSFKKRKLCLPWETHLEAAGQPRVFAFWTSHFPHSCKWENWSRKWLSQIAMVRLCQNKNRVLVF